MPDFGDVALTDAIALAVALHLRPDHRVPSACAMMPLIADLQGSHDPPLALARL